MTWLVVSQRATALLSSRPSPSPTTTSRTRLALATALGHHARSTQAFDTQDPAYRAASEPPLAARAILIPIPLLIPSNPAPTPPFRGRFHRPNDYFSGTPAEALCVLGNIAGALAFVHENGITHNDIKPGNILFSPARGAVLIDFGLSSDDAHTPATAMQMVGTP